jgi:hypothetical protein
MERDDGSERRGTHTLKYAHTNTQRDGKGEKEREMRAVRRRRGKCRKKIMKRRWRRAFIPSEDTVKSLVSGDVSCGKAGKHGKIATKKRHSAE